MNEKMQKFKNSGFLKLLKRGLSSKYFPFASAAVTLLCYYLGWDMALIYYLSVTGILMLTLLDDLTPFISVMLFLSIMVSYKHSPSNIMESSDYYFRTVNLVQIFIVLSLYVLAAVYRLGLTVAQKRFKLTPAFWGLCALAVAFMLNGMFSENYSAKNLLFGVIMAASFLGVFSVLKDNIKLNPASYEKIAFAFFAFSITLIIELAVKYLTADGLFADGNFIREKLTFGWGIWNTMGMWLVMCIPAVFYLAYKKKFGFIFTLYSVLLLAATMLSGSRQTMFFSVFIYALCAIILFVKGKYKIANICIVAVVVIAAIIIVVLKWETFAAYIKDSLEDFLTNGAKGNTRMVLWREAFSNYRASPLFGSGFYVKFTYIKNSGLGFMPYMCHNTVLQILSSCGTVGLIAYAIHRIQTVKYYIKNVTVERTFIMITILGLLLVSLVDNHIFNIFPTIVYSCLTAVIVNDAQKQ